VCGDAWQQDNESQRQSCGCCDFVACQRCLLRGLCLPGGGAFADVLAPELARALLADRGWLRYKARSYFFKADHNGKGHVDKFKVRRVDSRLAAELGVRQMTETELAQVLLPLIRGPVSGKTFESSAVLIDS
ncbi:unnamed protein product, partial [Polarella glacialis]